MLSVVWLHIDDCLLHGPNYAKVCKALTFILNETQCLGLLYEPVKLLPPAQVIKCCGFLYDTTSIPCIKIPASKASFDYWSLLWCRFVKYGGEKVSNEVSSTSCRSQELEENMLYILFNVYILSSLLPLSFFSKISLFFLPLPFSLHRSFSFFLSHLFLFPYVSPIWFNESFHLKTSIIQEWIEMTPLRFFKKKLPVDDQNMLCLIEFLD